MCTYVQLGTERKCIHVHVHLTQTSQNNFQLDNHSGNDAFKIYLKTKQRKTVFP